MTGNASRDRRQVRRERLQWDTAKRCEAEEQVVPETPAQDQEGPRTKKPSQDRRAQRRAHLQWSKAQEGVDDDASTMAPSSGSVRTSFCSVLSEEADYEEELPCSLTRTLDFSTPCTFPMRIRLASQVEAQAVVRRSFIHIQEATDLEACTRSAPAIMLSSGFNMASGRYEEEEEDEEEEVFEHDLAATVSYGSLDACASLDDSCSLCSTASTDASEERQAYVAVKNTFAELCALERPARQRSSRGFASYVAGL